MSTITTQQMRTINHMKGVDIVDAHEALDQCFFGRKVYTLSK